MPAKTENGSRPSVVSMASTTMTRMSLLAGAIGLLATLPLASTARASFSVPPRDVVEAPRFEVDQPEGRFPLIATRNEAEVVGPVAHVTVTQVYRNAGAALLDATYVFPGSTRSAVASLVMKIGERTVRADLRRREEARQVFEQARQEGFRASLLEQQRPNVFRMSLTNVRPGETVEVTLGYTELLEPEAGRYELVLPAVVAPRYGGASEGLEHRETLPPGSSAAPAWSADVRLADGLGVTEVTSPTHSVHPRVDAEGRVQVALTTDGDRELVLRWRLEAGAEPEAGVVLYEGQEERFFMMTVAPPRRPRPDLTPPREIAFLLDVSCSMQGYPLDVAKTVMQESLQKLRPSDRFNVLFFAGGSKPFREAPVPATKENVAAALAAVRSQRGGGGTELVEALSAVARLPRAEGLARTAVVVTDGLVSFERKAFAEVRKVLRDTTVFTLGIGSNVNRMLIEGLARAGGGTSYVAHTPDAAVAESKRLLVAIGSPVLTDLKLQIDGLDAYDLEPPTLPDLYADRPVVVVGKYRGRAKGKLTLLAHASDQSLSRAIELAEARPSAENAPLRALWARRRLQRIADDRDLASGGADAETIARLGLEYGLLTEHTAFVAVDSEGGRAQGERDSVAQPGPHPHGMADLARRRVAKGASMLRLKAASEHHAPSVSGLELRAGGVGPVAGAAIASPRDKAPARDARPATGAAEAAGETDDRARGARRLVEDEASAPMEPAAKKADRPHRLRLLPAIVAGDLSHEAVMSAARSWRSALEKLLADAGFGPARITLELEVDARGQVTSVKVVSADPVETKALEPKLLEALLNKRIGRDGSGQPGRIRLPIVYE